MSHLYKPDEKPDESKSKQPDYVSSIGKDRYQIDLASPKIKKKGDFPCPKCGTVLSPDDETEENYRIVDTKVKRNELSEIILQCKKCSSILTLTGFLRYLENRERK